MNKIRSIFGSGRTKIAIILIIMFSIASSYIAFSPITPNNLLDGSWKYALIKTKHLAPPMIFGKDIDFTWGPLGALAAGQVLISDKFGGFWAFRYLLLLATLFAIAFFFIRFSRTMKTKDFYSLFLVSAIFPILLYKIDVAWGALAFYLAYLSALPDQETRKRQIYISSLALLAAIALSLKISVGFHLCALTGLSIAAYSFIEKEARFPALITGSFCMASLIIWNRATGSGIAEFLAYIKNGVQVSSLYSEYMINSFDIAHYRLWFYLVPVIIIILNTYLGYRSGNIWSALIIFVSTFALYKNGFVRAEGHMIRFFTAQWFILICLASASKDKWDDKLLRKTFIFLFVFWFLTFQIESSWTTDYKMFVPQGYLIDSAIDLPRSINPYHSFALAQKESEYNLNKLRIRFKRLFNKLDKYCTNFDTITFLPFQLSFAELTKAKWMPLPTLQLYHSRQAFAYLEKDKKLFAGENAVDYIVIGKLAIDERSPAAEMSHIIKEIIGGYALIDEADNYMILKKNSSTKKAHESGSNIAGRTKGALVHVKVKHMKRQPWFGMQTALFKGPQFSIKIGTGDGRSSVWRMYASQLESGAYFGIPGASLEDTIRGTNSAYNGPITIEFLPEMFAGIAINRSPETEVRIVSFN